MIKLPKNDCNKVYLYLPKKRLLNFLKIKV
ncbi:hypothetical protein N405_04970 [Helicobacter pylori FD568]|nr:hypothetical protein N405_04970 [Helicobacter pylori FD568]